MNATGAGRTASAAVPETDAGAAPWPPLIIAVAPNGARRTHADHPALPMTAREIADDAAACAEAGASMIHLHVRDADGGHTLDPDTYREAMAAVHRAVGDRLIVQITTEAVGIYTPEEQMAAVRAIRPEAVSTAVRELVPDAKSESAAADFYAWLARERIVPQFILYDADDVRRFADLRARGVIPGETAFVLYVLGRYKADQRSEPADLLGFIDAAATVGRDWHWSICAFGPHEGACGLMAATLGGHVRVGMENNLYLNDGTLAPGNAALVRQIRDGASLLARPVADADAARDILARPPASVSSP